MDQSEASIHLLQLLARLVVADKGEVPGGVQTLGIMKGSEYGERWQLSRSFVFSFTIVTCTCLGKSGAGISEAGSPAQPSPGAELRASQPAATASYRPAQIFLQTLADIFWLALATSVSAAAAAPGGGPQQQGCGGEAGEEEAEAARGCEHRHQLRGAQAGAAGTLGTGDIGTSQNSLAGA